MKVAEIWAELGFKMDTTTLNDFVGAIGKLNLNTVMAAVGVDGLYEGLKNIMEVASQTTEGMYAFGKETGLSSQRMLQWSRYAEQAGIKGSVVEDSLGGLQKKMAAIKFGDTSLLSGIFLLQQAGAKISPSDLNDPFKFLDKATEGLHKISPELKTYVAGLLGLNSQLLLMDNFKGADNLVVPNDTQIVHLRDFSREWTKVGQAMNMAFVNIGDQFAPQLEVLGKVFEKIFNLFNKFPSVIRTIVDLLLFFIGVAGGPLTAIGSLIAIIALNMKDIGDVINSITSKIPHFNIQRASDDIHNPFSTFRNASVGGASGAEVTQHNAITIISNDIKDIEHKLSDFFKKTMAQTFYQNSFNV